MDQNGYPTSLAPGQTAGSAGGWSTGGYPVGPAFVLLWDGSGTMDFQGSDCTLLSTSPGRMTMRMNSATGAVAARIVTTDPADHVRNIRLLWPGTESTHQTNPWNPLFLNAIAPFGVLRFMDWGKTNDTQIVDWSRRTKVDAACYAEGAETGVPIEVMCDLCNRLKAHPWICIPHRANYDYVSNLAAVLKANLDPTLRPRIEYCNEMWNSGFGQTQWGRLTVRRAGTR